MIDDHSQAMELIRKIEAQLPITAKPGKAFIQTMQKNGIKVKTRQHLQITKVLYMGDEGGIMCIVEWPGQKTGTGASLTHLKIKANHPLAEEIRAYQMERTRRLAQTNRQQGSIRFPANPFAKRKR